MLDAYGWCVLRVSREPYRDVTLEGDNIDKIDDEIDAADEELANKLTRWLDEINSPPAFMCTVHHQMWSKVRVLLFTSFRNHRASQLWEFLDWITANAPGSYGIVYVHDDEDIPENNSYGRGKADYSNEFRVFRIAKGELEEFDDPFLSPIYPTINPSEYC